MKLPVFGRAPRWARVVAFVVVGLFPLYLLAANVILRTGLLRHWLNEDEQELRVEYASAWSFYPGHVKVRGLSIRFQDSNVQLHLGLEKASLNLDLWALSQHALRVRRLDAQGGTFRMRHKGESLQGNEGRIRAFPPIVGFPDLPQPPDPPKPSDPTHESWTIELTDIDATMREVWTMEYHYRGDAAVTGGFHLKPHSELWILPSVMITHGGVLALGERELIRGGDGRVEASMDPFDLRDAKGIQVLRHLSGSVHQSGELASLASVAATYFPGETATLDRGTGPIEIDTQLEHGVFQPGSRVTYLTSDAVLKTASIQAAGDLGAVARVEGPLDHPLLAVDAAMTKSTVSPIASPAAKPALEVHDLRVSVTLDTADLVAHAGIGRASVAIVSARSPDLRTWQPLAPESCSFDGGAASLALRADYERGVLEGRFDTVLEQARMTFDTFKVAASGKVWSGIASAAPSKVVTFPGASADLDGISMRMDRGHAEGLWLRARARSPMISTRGPVAADADIAIASGPGERTLELFTRMAHIPDVATDVATGTELQAALHLRVRPREVSLAVTEAKNGAVHGRGAIRKSPAGLKGAFLLSVGPIQSGLEVEGGNVSVHPLARTGWLDDKLRQR